MDLLRRTGTTRVAAVIAAVALMSAGVGVARAGEPTSNLELLRSMTTEVAEEIVGQLKDDIDDHGLRLKPAATTDQYQFIGNVLATVLMKHGVSTYLEGAPSGGASGGAPVGAKEPLADALDLEFQAVEFDVAYTDVYRSHLIGGKRIRRRADVMIVATLVTPGERRVLSIARAKREHEDQFAQADLAAVEQGTYEFSKSTVPPSGWTKAVEPVFVSGIIVGLIYLFFSNQSGS